MVPFKIASTMRDSRLNTAPVWLCWSLSATALRVSCFCVDTKNVFEHGVENTNQTHVFTGSIKSWIGRNWYMIDSQVVCMLKKTFIMKDGISMKPFNAMQWTPNQELDWCWRLKSGDGQFLVVFSILIWGFLDIPVFIGRIRSVAAVGSC